MPKNGVRSTFSQAPFQIAMCDLGGVISTGTAFYYTVAETRYLVTNWHNMTGRDFFSGKNLKSHGRTPLWIEVATATWLGQSAPGCFGIRSRRVEIYGDPAAQLDPLWREHPTKRCDIVALKDEKPTDEPEFMHNSVNRISAHQIPVKPGGLAFVIGFPRGLHVGFGLPIWKSAYIASEPFYSITVGGNELPAFFLDGYTREGMSGSPVFAQYSGRWDMGDPYREVDIDAPEFWNRADVALSETGVQFVGIYSGRIPSEVTEAAIGICWTEEAIREICEYTERH